MSFGSFLSLASSILGLAGLAGLATAGLLSARRRETGRILSELVATQGIEIEGLKRREDECTTRLASQQGQIETLRELVTQAAAVARLTERVDLHHEVLLRRLDQISAGRPGG